MNPIFDPGTSGAPQFVPGTNPQLFTPLSAGGDPGTVGGGGGGGLAQTPGTPNTSTAGGSGVPEAQQQHQAYPGGPSTRPSPTGGQPNLQPGAQPSNLAAMAAWDPAMHPGRRRPTMPGLTNPNHLGAIGTDYSRYAMGGNIGNSLAGAKGNYQPVDSVGDYAWMQDPSIQWGGGPFGYLPINYQPQSYDYYSTNMNQLAPWEYKYFNDTFTQNYDPSQPGYVDTQRAANDPNYRANLRG